MRFVCSDSQVILYLIKIYVCNKCWNGPASPQGRGLESCEGQPPFACSGQSGRRRTVLSSMAHFFSVSRLKTFFVTLISWAGFVKVEECHSRVLFWVVGFFLGLFSVEAWLSFVYPLYTLINLDQIFCVYKNCFVLSIIKINAW